MSFGGGLALQSSFPQNNFARDYYQQSQRKKVGKEKAIAQEAKDSDKYLNSIQVELGKGKFHPLYFKDAQNVTAGIISAAAQAQAESAQTGQNWAANTNFQMKLAEGRNTIQQLRSLSDGEYTTDETLVKDLVDGTGDAETAESVLNLRRAGDVEGLKKFQDPYGYYNSNKTPVGGFYSSSVRPYKKIDLPKIIRDRLTDPDIMTWRQNIANNQGLPANVRGMLSESGIPNTEAEAKILQKEVGYKETPPSVEGNINAIVEDNFREMEKLVRGDAKKLAEAAGEDYTALKDDGRKPYVKEAALTRAIPQKGHKITEKSFRLPAPPKATQADRDKEWKSEGTSFFNGRNKITVSDVKNTDLGKLMGLPPMMKSSLPKDLIAIAESPNGKVLSFAHTDATENKPLIFTDQKGAPINGIPKAVIGDNTNPKEFEKTAKVILAINDPDSKTGLSYRAVQYNSANKDVIKNEYGKTAEEALEALGGKTGTTSDGGVKSTSKSSGKSGKTVSKRQYSASRNQTKIIYSDGTEEIIEGK